VNPAEPVQRTSRRGEIVEAAMHVLAQSGSRGLTHREVDRLAGLPLGSTSNYFRKRIDLLVAVGSHVMALDLADTRQLKEELSSSGPLTHLIVARHVHQMLDHWTSLSQRTRGLARVEILVETIRSSELREAVSGLIRQAEESFSTIFAELGATQPLLSAELFLRLMTSIDLLILTDLNGEGHDRMIRLLVIAWLETALNASALRSGEA
jgi:AcrR family transcriptional regulator